MTVSSANTYIGFPRSIQNAKVEDAVNKTEGTIRLETVSVNLWQQISQRY